ncbi:hypothetical protein C7999DRAFT_40552 [Corynascus novoguineensis]|uniref:Uncharacterized protein n=1 Tax=Corynascus novoguineensis TaxID=1126955 RepID=A0AAN7HPV2_9PEZI|nr:hypothetical protein C7999DRAFT_40552 [Corynascus novoguineensis]
MPELHEVSYSHEATIAASYVAEPPEGGWPEISLENLSSLGKTNEAILLLRHLPYISSRDDSAQESMSPHVVCLTRGSYLNPCFLLDTKLGVVFWEECDSDVKRNPSREPIFGEEYDNGPTEEETDFRCDSVAWAVPDFEELLKDLFRQLFYVPVSPRVVYHASALKEVVPMLEAIYREHGWPDLERSRKRECLNAVQDLMERRDPDCADRRREGED